MKKNNILLFFAFLLVSLAVYCSFNLMYTIQKSNDENYTQNYSSNYSEQQEIRKVSKELKKNIVTSNNSSSLDVLINITNLALVQASKQREEFLEKQITTTIVIDYCKSSRLVMISTNSKNPKIKEFIQNYTNKKLETNEFESYVNNFLIDLKKMDFYSEDNNFLIQTQNDELK